MTDEQPEPGTARRPAGIEGSVLPGPFSVAAYARQLRQRLLGFARVQVFGDLVNFEVSNTSVYFELRDELASEGGLMCSMWREDFEQLDLTLTEGARVVVAGGCEFYPGSTASSPSFSFRVRQMRLAGDGELLAEIARRREELRQAGLLEPQKWLLRPAVPDSIGVITAKTGRARDDVLAGLQRRGWAGRLVWAFVPVQDRYAAHAVGRAMQDLAAVANVDVIIVARGGGSVMDLMAFSDETLCRTVAMLSVPVIASVGHHTDRTLLDDVAAVSASTPTHAAESAVPSAPGEAQRAFQGTMAELARLSRAMILRRRRLVGYLRAAVDTQDPKRVLSRGFALVEDQGGTPIGGAKGVTGTIRIRFHDGLVAATVNDPEGS